jgi:hypothetical protein
MALLQATDGQHEWVAGFLGQIWNDGSRTPIQGQIVDVHWVDKQERPLSEQVSSVDSWGELTKEVREETRQKDFEEQLRKNKGLDSLTFIMSRTKSADVSSKEMGDKSELVEENHNSVQQPLPPEDRTTKWVKQATQYPNIRIRDKIFSLQEKMSTPEFQRMRWVKLARKKSISCFEPPDTLEATPVLSIDYKRHPMLMIPPREMTHMKRAIDLGRNWRESFHWDLVSRRVAEVKMQTQGRNSKSGKMP